ncbi:MAG: hypothetical protein R3B69_03295 [Candidatus Paceibacterota bacterium]
MQHNVFGTLETSFRSLWSDVLFFLPELVLAIVILVAGWIIAGILKHLVEKVFDTLKVNDALDAAGVDKLTERAGYKLKAGQFVGTLVKWFVIVVFFIAVLDILSLDQVTIFFRDVVLGYLPKVIVSVLILLIAMVVANVASASVTAGARAAGFGASSMLGTVTRYAIILFAVLAVLSQLEIAPALVETLFMGIIFGTSLAFGLSFGLGGKEAAGRYINKLLGGGDHHHHN